MSDSLGEDFIWVQDSYEGVRMDQKATEALLAELETKGLITDKQHQACYKKGVVTTNRVVRRDSAKKPTFELPDLSNSTVPGLIDMIGTSKETQKREEKLEEVYWNRLKFLVEQDKQDAEPKPEEPSDEST